VNSEETCLDRCSNQEIELKRCITVILHRSRRTAGIMVGSCLRQMVINSHIVAAVKKMASHLSTKDGPYAKVPLLSDNGEKAVGQAG